MTRVPGLLACDQATCTVQAMVEGGMGKHAPKISNCRPFVKLEAKCGTTEAPFGTL